MLQVGVIAAFIAVSAIYAGPSVLAIMKGHRRWPLVVIINLLFGWSIIGWFAALALALGIAPQRPAWSKRVRKSRAKPAASAIEPQAAAPPGDVADPPEVHEDIYAAWLDEGAALPGSGRESRSA